MSSGRRCRGSSATGVGAPASRCALPPVAHRPCSDNFNQNCCSPPSLHGGSKINHRWRRFRPTIAAASRDSGTATQSSQTAENPARRSTRKRRQAAEVSQQRQQQQRARWGGGRRAFPAPSRRSCLCLGTATRSSLPLCPKASIRWTSAAFQVSSRAALSRRRNKNIRV